jgi:uncharacterized repeat protein (TIGR01451 family)
MKSELPLYLFETRPFDRIIRFHTERRAIESKPGHSLKRENEMEHAQRSAVFRLCITLTLMFSTLLFVLAQSVLADTLIVTTTGDSGAGSLRQAIADAAPGDTIVFDAGLAGQTIVLSSSLSIAKALTIDGSSLITPVAISGNHATRVFDISSGGVVTLSHLSIISGTTTSTGGGIRNDHGTLVVRTSTLAGNTASNRGGAIYNLLGKVTLQNCVLADNSSLNGNGGGVHNDGNNLDYGAATLIVQNSTFSGNQAAAYSGGGISGGYSTLVVTNSTFSDNMSSAGGGGIFASSGILTVQNSTFSGNQATASDSKGGGIQNAGATLTLQNSTLSANTAITGGGLYNDGALYYYNTLIAGSPSGGDCSTVYAWQIHHNVRNLVQDGSCDAQVSGDPLLDTLADNGGPTAGSGQAILTHALLPGSPAIDAGDPTTCLTTDQRGVARPIGAGCDIGAIESPLQPILAFSKSVTPATKVPYHSTVTYTLVLTNTGGMNDAQVTLTDTLPIGVSFGQWKVSHGAIAQGSAITWTGTLTANTVLSFTFTATHTGEYADHITNTAYLSSTLQTGSAAAAFDVTCGDVYTVTNAADSGPGSLRQAIAAVCPGGKITFDGDTSLYLSSELAIAKRLTIDGSGHTVTISGDTGNDGTPDVRVFAIEAEGATLSHLYIVSGTTPGSGGGLSNAGTLTITGCTLSGNSAGQHGGGLSNDGILTVQNSTFFGNTAGQQGGGLYNSGTLILQNGTVSSNAASNGGGIANDGTLTLQNSLIANSPAGGACAYPEGTVDSTHALADDDTCGTGFAVSSALLLGTLGDYGGDIPTIPLLPGSTAVDAGDDTTCLSTDQRGVARPQGAACDIGAFEAQQAILSMAKSVTPATNVPYHGVVTYTLVLSAIGPLSDSGVIMTDRLPAGVVFGEWRQQPGGALRTGSAITWTGVLTPHLPITLTFTAIHTGAYADVITNTALLSGTWQTRSAAATLTVIQAPQTDYMVYLPLVIRNP